MGKRHEQLFNRWNTYKNIINLIRTQKMHIKITVRCYFTPINLEKIQKPDSPNGEDEEEQKLIPC